MQKRVYGVLFLIMVFCLGACAKPEGTEGQDRMPEGVTGQQDTDEKGSPAEPEADTGETGEEGFGSLEFPSAETVPEETATEKVPDEIITVTISAAGDVTLGNLYGMSYEWSFDEMYEQQSPEYFFENVKPVFEADDMTIVNFEGVLTLTDERVEKKYNMKGKPEYVHILTAGDIETVSLANNHRLDYGEQGFADTLEALESVGIPYAYDSVVGYYETKGITVGYISFNEVYDGKAVEQFIQDGIVRLQEAEADLILACCHWGSELENYPEDYQTTLAQMCIDLGADLVIGHHPHVLQGVSVYQGKYIVYSLGNFCFGGNKKPKDMDTMIFQQTFTFVNGEKQEDDNIKVIPASISSVNNRNDYRPTPAEGAEAQRIIDKVNTFSEGFGVGFDYDGSLIKSREVPAEVSEETEQEKKTEKE